MKRRPFLHLSGLAAIGFTAPPVFATEFDRVALLYARFVPREKNLSADWLASLTERDHILDNRIRHGKDEVDLDIIGMTVVGIGCGTVYLSGDGRLWVWDIFNQHHEGVVPNKRAEIPAGLQNIADSNQKPRERDGANFLLPPRVDDHRNGVDARFSLRHADIDLPLEASDWDKVVFTNQWPIGRVDFSTSQIPLTVTLEACSPFIPLDLKSSSLPVTVFEYTLDNPTPQPLEAMLTGQLNNPAGQFSGREGDRFTEPISTQSYVGLYHGLNGVRDGLDTGSMALALLAAPGTPRATVDTTKNRVSIEFTVPPKGRSKIRFVIAWHFPNLSPEIGVPGVKRHYVRDFADAREVLDHFARNQEPLLSGTRRWTRVWYDSSLPRWLMERVVLTTNTLQTQNCLIFDDGRFWAWEGVGCCPGTCGHVWQYSQGHARLFPEIERNLREVTDYGLAQQSDGSIAFRGTNNKISAIDSQCAYVLRTLRDHQLSDDPGYLKRVWKSTRAAIGYLVEFDRKDDRGGLDGLLDGEQHNTLDAEWFGKVHVLCSMYLAALRAGEELARAMNDGALALELRAIHAMGAENISKLFNGEYYEQIEDPAHADAIGVGKGCYIDQVMGQFWANQVGLGRIFDAGHQKSALRALWTYNFLPDYGPFRQGFPQGRHYATAGDSGLLMCTWPKGGLRDDFKNHWQYAYFNEFMTGFEYEAAAHMISERDDDLVQAGLAITRAIHDRYSATRGRNPFNEIECSDHYARAGASYAVFLALCGFHYDQSKSLLRFDPVFQQHDFKVPFTTSEAWGTFEQEKNGARLTLAYGKLRLEKVELPYFDGKPLLTQLNGRPAEGMIGMKAGDELSWSVL